MPLSLSQALVALSISIIAIDRLVRANRGTSVLIVQRSILVRRDAISSDQIVSWSSVVILHVGTLSDT